MNAVMGLMKSSRKFTRIAFILAGLVACCYGSWSQARVGLSRLMSTYGERMSNLASVDHAIRLNPTDPEAHHARALVLEAMGKDDEAAQEFEISVRLRPDDYYLWLELGDALEETNDLAGADKAFREAVRLAPYYAQPHWQLGNYVLRTGDTDEAFIELRRAVASDITLFPAMIDLAWGAYGGNSQAVLNAVQPSTDSARLVLARYFAVHEDAIAAMNLFRTIGVGVNAEERRSLVSELIAGGKFSEAHEVWKDGLINNPNNGAILYDGGFEKDIKMEEAGFGWKPFREGQTFRFALDAKSARAGTRSLRLEYKGGFDTGTPVISQLVLVKPSTQYRLRFATRSQDLISAGLPVVTVKTTDLDARVLVQSKPLARGTSDWRDETVSFVTSATTRAVVICIQREACSVSPCPIFGFAWFDDFNLEEL